MRSPHARRDDTTDCDQNAVPPSMGQRRPQAPRDPPFPRLGQTDVGDHAALVRRVPLHSLSETVQEAAPTKSGRTVAGQETEDLGGVGTRPGRHPVGQLHLVGAIVVMAGGDNAIQNGLDGA